MTIVMFKPSQTVDWFYMETKKHTPQSTTHEMLETGYAKQKAYNKVCKKALNFRTYSMNDFRFDDLMVDRPKELPITTTYERNYSAQYGGNICPGHLTKGNETIPDKFWNRKPLNDFALERIISSEFKFMDDHLINVTEQRKRINFLRQIRNQHHPLV